MSIKPDNWIRRKAENGMIVPFTPDLVSHVDGNKIVSYGTSSYGYDVRCADEFKIFTNINSTVVDPKNFDDKCFVDFKGDVCIIPPNSFALARTVEYFNIPPNVMVVCLGKSTYARCFTADTKIAGVMPSFMSMGWLVEEYEKDQKEYMGYALSSNQKFTVVPLKEPRLVGKEEVVDVTLTNGQVHRCTPDHEFIIPGMKLIEAQYLKSGQRLLSMSIGASIVESVKPVEGLHEVFCLTVPKYGNFALHDGIFVKNCGIVVNVTPIEPSWSGNITLEFSNTTPLPAKIYANEGVAQLLFFESDEQCSTTYKDRNGKYQGQTGVTPPKV